MRILPDETEFERGVRTFGSLLMRITLEPKTVRLDEIPYDFTRKRLSVLASVNGQPLLITKGALTQVLESCRTVEMPDGRACPLADQIDHTQDHYEKLSARGLRTLGLAYKPLVGGTTIKTTDEADLTFLGFLVFADPPQVASQTDSC